MSWTRFKIKRNIRRLTKVLSLIILGVFVALVGFEVLIRLAWDLFGKAEASLEIDAECRPVEVIPLLEGQNFTGRLQFDELLMRRFMPDLRTADAIQEEPYEVFTLSTNEYGWRDVSHTLEKPPDTYRIALIGNSYVEGIFRPLEQTITPQLDGS